MVIQIVVYTACIAFCWVCLLTEPNGLLASIPKKYGALPEFVQRVLICVPCLAGWMAIFSSFGISIYDAIYTGSDHIIIATLWIFWNAFISGILAMTLGKLIQSFSER